MKGGQSFSVSSFKFVIGRDLTHSLDTSKRIKPWANMLLANVSSVVPF